LSGESAGLQVLFLKIKKQRIRYFKVNDLTLVSTA
jgi:hypothetical protein